MKRDHENKQRVTKTSKTIRPSSLLSQVHSFVLNMILCLGLYSTHLPLAHADTLESLRENADATAATSSDLSSTGTQETTATVGSSGSTQEGNYQKIEGENIDPKAKMLLGNIALFAATMAAPVLLKQCPSAYSVWIYTGSAALYLANEIGLFTRFKNASDAEMAAYIGRGDEDKQIESLETAAEQTDKAKKAAKRRALIAKIAAGGFAAAAAMSVAENYWDWAKSAAGACGKQAKADTPEVETPATPAGGAAPTGTSSIDELDREIYYAQQQNVDPKLLVLDSDNFDFMMSYREQSDYLSGKTHSISVDDYEKEKLAYGDEINKFAGLKTALIGLTEFSMNLISSQAQAKEEDEDKKKSGINWTGSGMKALTGMLGAGAGIIMLNSKVYEKTGFVKKPITRAIGFGAFSAFAIGAAKESDDAADKLEQRSQEYRKLANSLRQQVAGNTTTTNAPAQQTVAQTSSATDDDNRSSGSDDFCITGSNVNSISVDESCNCSSGNSCKKTQLPQLSSMPEFAGKSILSDSVKSLKSAGDSVYAGRLEGATTAANGLSKNAARISKLRDALVKKINKDDKDAGGKGDLDLNKLQGKFADQMLNKVNRSFNNLSDAEKASLARFAPALGDSDSSATAAASKDSKSSDADPAVGGTGKIATGSAGNNKSSGSSWDFNFDEDDASKAANPEAAALAKAMAQEDDDYLIEGDINDDRNKDIFKIITGRYLKSAYPVIFEEQ